MDTPAESSLGRLLRDRRSARELGCFIVHFSRSGSTNDVARLLAERGAPHGTLVSSDEQTAGRGRWRRSWASAPGGLYLSAVLRRPGSEPRLVSLVPLAASIAAAEAVQESAGVSVRLRWPNDLFLGDAKLGGVLCETSFSGSVLEFLIAGFGINVNQEREGFPAELAGSATSLRLATGRQVDREPLAARLAERLESWWRAVWEEAASVRRRWEELALEAGSQKVRVEPKDAPAFEAVVEGLAEDGGLRVRSPGGEPRVLHSEEVVYLRPA